MNLFSRIVTIPFALAASFCFAGDDIDFARGLARDGFVQQAEEICRRIEGGKDAQEKAAVPLVRAEIAMKRAAAAATLAEAREELARGAAAIDAFAAANPGHPRLIEARLQAGLMRRQCGEVAEQEASENGAGAVKARERGREELEKALKDFENAGASAKARKQAIETGLAGRPAQGKDAKDLEDAEGQVAEAPYQAARCLHLRARLETEPGERKKWLERAHGAFMDLEFDFGETSLVMEASLTWAVVLRDLGRNSEALGRFDVAWKVSQPWRDRIIAGPLPAWEREVSERAMGGRAETLTAMGNPAAALESIEALLRVVPNAAQDRSGFLAVLEKGAALAALGRKKEAANLALALVQAAPSAVLRDIAVKRLMQWGGAKSPAARRLIANTEYANGNWAQALAGYRELAAILDMPEGEVSWRLAVCTDRLDRTWEAVVLYESFAVEFPQAANAPAAVFRAAQIWNSIASAAGDAGTWEHDQVGRMLKVLVDRWPDDPNARNAVYLVADSAFERGDYEEAALNFARVPKDAKLNLQALCMIGRCYHKLAEQRWADPAKRAAAGESFKLAERHMREAIEALIASTGESRAGLLAFTRLSLVSLLLHEQDSRPGLAIHELEAVGPLPQAEQERRFGELMIRARVANGEPAVASDVAAGLAKRFKAVGSTGKACRDAAAACDAAAEAGGADADALRLAAIARYADSLDIALAANTPPAGPDAAAITDHTLQLALSLNGIPDDASVDDAPATLPHPEALADAARIARVAATCAGLPQGWSADFRLARALSFSGNLEGARHAYEGIVEDAGVVRDGKFSAAAIQGRAWVLASYEELGFTHLKLAEKSGRAADFDAAGLVFANLVHECAAQSGPWWRSKVGALRMFAKRGKPGDFELAVLGMKDLLGNHPDLDEGKFGIKPKVEALKKWLDAKAPPAK
jgi:tetratricopeptide (TPR) repeat protein